MAVVKIDGMIIETPSPYWLTPEVVINHIESTGVMNNKRDGLYYVDMSRYNNSGNCLFNLSTCRIDRATALTIFKLLNINYSKFEITINKIGQGKPYKTNKTWDVENRP